MIISCNKSLNTIALSKTFRLSVISLDHTSNPQYFTDKLPAKVKFFDDML